MAHVSYFNLFYSDPTPNSDLGVQWPEYSVKGKQYLDIGEELTAGSAPDEEELKLWENIVMKYAPQK